MTCMLWRKQLEGRNVLQLIVPYIVFSKQCLKDIHEGAAGGPFGGRKDVRTTEEAFLLARV